MPPSAHPPGGEPPLVVDLDGTLIKSDLLVESLLVTLSRRPVVALKALAALGRGKAAFKQALAATAVIDCAVLPFNAEFLEFLRQEHARGRAIYLASGSDRSLVKAVAKVVGLFSGVFASDGKTNLSGESKAAFLVEKFGEHGFDYAGNSRKDIPVWRAARDVILVGPNRVMANSVRRIHPDMRHFDALSTAPRALCRALRLHQWPKNLLIFVPAILAHRVSSEIALPLIIAFLSFSLCASSAYVANDLLDLGNDRAHVRKRYRPLASGNLSLSYGLVLVPVLLAASVVLAQALSVEFLFILLGYYALTMGYSVVLKRKLIVDVATLAGLYGMRLAAGAIAIAVPLSPWFVAFAMFIFLCLALVKRSSEIIDRIARDAGDPKGRGYIQRDLPMLEMMAAGTGYVAIMVFALYINSPAVIPLYSHPEYLWADCLVLFYWISRVLLLTNRGEMHDDPVVFAATDPKSWICGLLLVAISAFGI